MSNDPILHLLGLAKKAGRLEVGEEPVGAACRARQARLILLASDAAPNTRRRAAHFGEAGGILWLEIPFDKGELGSVLGRASCAMLAFTDAGFAASACAKLAARDPDRYGPAALQLRTKADRLLQRQREQRQHEKNVRKGKRSWAPPSKDGPPSPGEKAAAPKEGGPRPPKAARRPKAGPARRPETGPGPIQTPAKGGPGRRRLTGTSRKPYEVIPSMMIKYPVHKVAKDFKRKGKDIPSKEIMDILAQHGHPPKNHMQPLSDLELSIVFEYLTQHNQIDSIQSVYADVYHEPAAKQEPAPKTEPARPAPKGEKREQPAQQGGAKPGAQQAKQPVQQPASRVPAKKVVDTRGGPAVNLDKYDERLESFTDQRRQDVRGGKQKIQQKSQQRRQQGGRGQSGKRRQEEQDRMRRLQLEIAKKAPLKVLIPDEIGVGELASRMKKTGAEVVKCLIRNGVMASLSDIIDFDTAAIIAEEMGCKVEKEIIVTIEERLIDTAEDHEEDLKPRAPVVVVMGHVDHGKTSLLDYIRNANVTAGEAGGITQHIGAYQVDVKGNTVTFLDTPGHEAFTAMRARGAMITDIAILVVAADDGIMPQTIESINHAKAADIPIIVAINKMDKPAANPDRIMQQLTEYGLVPEDWGGETIVRPISAKTGMGIDDLLDMVVLTAEVQELKANPDRTAHGVVIEARLDKGRGPIATLLVQKGTLKQGDVIIAGTAVGRVRAMTDARGKKLTEAGPSVPVEIIGMSEVPGAGDDFHAVADERMARELVEQRKHEQKASLNSSVGKVTLEDLFSQIKQGEMKDLNIIVKADVQGSAEAVKASLEKLTNEEVRVRVIHCAVGAISENDVMLAATSGAIIVGFNVRPDNNAKDSAARMKVDMRMYRVIYDAINEIEAAMKGMLAPKFREVDLGRAEVRNVFRITNVGMVAGCYVLDGKMQRGAQMRLLRDNIVIYDGAIASLQRFKDSVKEVASGYECGITFEKFQDIKEGDIIEAYLMEQIEV